MFSLICVWINGWVNNREARDLRRYRAHCDVTVMETDCIIHGVYRISDKISSAIEVHSMILLFHVVEQEWYLQFC